jgi:hypothetical protein
LSKHFSILDTAVYIHRYVRTRISGRSGAEGRANFCVGGTSREVGVGGIRTQAHIPQIDVFLIKICIYIHLICYAVSGVWRLAVGNQNHLLQHSSPISNKAVLHSSVHPTMFLPPPPSCVWPLLRDVDLDAVRWMWMMCRNLTERVYASTLLQEYTNLWQLNFVRCGLLWCPSVELASCHQSGA